MDFKESTISNYSGLSSETKPTIAAGTNVPNGSRWRELDTLKEYHFNLSDDTWYQSSPQVDKSTHAVTTISYPHHEIHGGSGYDYTEIFELSNNEVLDIQITTPAGSKYAHLIFDYLTEKEAEFWLWENVAIALAGSSVTPRNHRRASADNSILTVKYIENTSLANANTDTATAGATLLAHTVSGEGGKKGTGGGGDSREEWILAPSEDYCLRWEVKADGYVAFHIDWYEHSDKA